MPVKPCPHCHAKAEKAVCKNCNRDMCVECISGHHSIGDVCGLCYDRIVSKED